MNLTSNEWVVVALLSTVSLIIGYLTGNRERKIDEAIVTAEDFQQHWASALWVVRRPTPPLDETVAS